MTQDKSQIIRRPDMQMSEPILTKNEYIQRNEGEANIHCFLQCNQSLGLRISVIGVNFTSYVSVTLKVQYIIGSVGQVTFKM